jgi:hypothetical protein
MMFRKIAGWSMVAVGVVGALLGLLVIIGGEMGDGGTMMGIGAGLAFSGWSVRGGGRLSGGIDDRDFNNSDYDSSSDSDSGDGDSGGSDFGD